MTTFPNVRAVSKDAGTNRVVVGGQDITWFRATKPGDGPTRVPNYTLMEPFAYGASGSIAIPRTNAMFEQYGVGELAWLKQGATVLYQRVTDDGTVTDYRGIVVAIRPSSREFVVDVAGEMTGRTTAHYKPQVLARDLMDLGSMVSKGIRGFGFQISPRYPETGIVYPNQGDMSWISWLQQLCTWSQTAEVNQRSIMPVVWGEPLWQFEPKNTTTVDLTLYADGTRIALNLVDDAMEQPNTVYGSGVSPTGERWRNAKYPNMIQGPAPQYPIAGGAAFGVGTTDADTISGDGITLLRGKLAQSGYLSDTRSIGSTYDTYVAAAVNRVKEDAGLTEDGEVTLATWAALYNIDVTGYSTEGAQIVPLAQTTAVRKYNRSSTGAILGRNPDYVPGSLVVARTIDYGVCDKERATRHAKKLIYSTAGHQWAGTITLNGISAFTGEHDETDAEDLTADDLMPMRDIRPGMNAWLPYFDGGTLVHISGVDYSPGSPDTVTLTVDTGARDLLDLTQALKRNQESRRDIRREWMTTNRGTKAPGNFVQRDEWFGKLYQDVDLVGGQWNTVELVMGQSGTVNRTDIRVTNTATEFCVAVFAHPITADRLNAIAGDPFSVDGDGLTTWEHEWAQTYFDRNLLLYVAGQGAQPGGYGWKKGYDENGDRTANPLIGTLVDASTWSYISDPTTDCTVHVAIYPLDDCTLRRGQLFYALEDDVT